MPELKEVEAKLATKSETIRKNAAAIEKEYNDLIEKFQKTPSDSITQSIAIDRQTQIENLQNRYQKFLQDSQVELEKEQQTLLAPLQQKMRQAIQDVGKEQNYGYILDAASLMYVSPTAVDASKSVKTKLGITD